MKRARIIVKGKVQRVGYRDEVEEIARRLSSYKIETEPPRRKSILRKITEREKRLIDSAVRIRANAEASG